MGLLGCVGLFGGQIVLGSNQLHMIMYSIYYIAAIECGFGFFGCMCASREVCECVCGKMEQVNTWQVMTSI